METRVVYTIYMNAMQHPKHLEGLTSIGVHGHSDLRTMPYSKLSQNLEP